MRSVDINSTEIENNETFKRSRKPLSISANVDAQPEFAANLGFFRDARVMTPLMMFFLDSLIESGESVESIAKNYESHVDGMVEELLKD